MDENNCDQGFCGIGEWEGSAEVYDSGGRYIADAVDQRHVRSLGEDGRIRIDLSFVGPIKFQGHYFIENKKDARLYQGPVNYGRGESLGKDCVCAHAYWPVTGLSQKFFLMITPDGQKQMSLALMGRGEHFLYAIVGENNRSSAANSEITAFVNGTSHDLRDDPCAGRKKHYFKRDGSWEGELFAKAIDGVDAASTSASYRHVVRQVSDGELHECFTGSQFLPETVNAYFRTDSWQAWSLEKGALFGSHSFYGGRAMSGQYHFLKREQRVWRREVVSRDGQYKALLNIWYQGERMIGSEWGFLKFREGS